MTNYTINTTYYTAEYVDALEKMFTRMGWMPEREDGAILITVPCEDGWIFDQFSRADMF